MKNTLETRLGLFFAIALIGAIIILEMAGGFNILQRGYHVHALFKDVSQLKVGDPVKLAGVEVGKVDRIAITNDQVRVTMRLNAGAQVRTDSTASIQFAGLMGQNFVSLDFGTPGGPIAQRDTILPTRTQPDLNAIMAKLDNVATGIENVTKSFTGDTINNLLGPITDFIKQNQQPLTAMIGNLRTISDRIAAGEGTVGRLINEDTLYLSALNTVSNLQNTSEEIKLTIGQARVAITNAQTIVEGINAGQGTVGKLIKDDALYLETMGAMTNLHQILGKINRGEGSVGKLVNDESLLKNVKLSLQKLDKATESLEDTGPLNVLGTMVGTLF
jgi:phospholipid/cholesterol/gamma-HCH transport system substrate-binding protein